MFEQISTFLSSIIERILIEFKLIEKKNLISVVNTTIYINIFNYELYCKHTLFKLKMNANIPISK